MPYSLKVYDGDHLLDTSGPGYTEDGAIEEARFRVHQDGASKVEVVPDDAPDQVHAVVRFGRVETRSVVR